MKDVLGALEGLVGAEALRPVGGCIPEVVVCPGATEEVAEVLKLAARAGWGVLPAGAATWLPPAGAGRPILVLSTERLAREVAYVPADLTASVSAGSSLGELQALLAPHGQWLPLDPPAADRATLGAVVSLADAGPARLGYGTPRDHVLGLEVVTGDGRVLRLGGQVVKNVAGYDLTRLLVGSRGALGVITRVNLRLRPLPERDETLALECPDAAEARATLLALRARGVEPVAAELLAPPLSGAVLDAAPGSALLVRLHGPAEWVERCLGAAEAVAAERRLPCRSANAGAWQRLSGLERDAAGTLRVALRASSFAECFALGSRLRAALGGGLVAHVGDGIVRVLLEPGGAGAEARGELERVRAAVASRQGTMRVSPGPRCPLGPADGLSASATLTRLMTGLRRAFDPHGILEVAGLHW